MVIFGGSGGGGDIDDPAVGSGFLAESPPVGSGFLTGLATMLSWTASAEDSF
jgi:hypothetical protein